MQEDMVGQEVDQQVEQEDMVDQEVDQEVEQEDMVGREVDQQVVEQVSGVEEDITLEDIQIGDPLQTTMAKVVTEVATAPSEESAQFDHSAHVATKETTSNNLE